MPVDLYTLLAQPFTNDGYGTHQSRPGDDNQIDPHTIYTASIETIDNDYVGSLLGVLNV